MPRPIFQAFLGKDSKPTNEQPSWATHVVEHKHDMHDGEKKLFWALYDKSADNGKGEYRLGPDTFGCFHPWGYTVFDTTPFNRVANSKIETVAVESAGESQAVGEKWWIKNGSKGDLIKVEITYITEKVVTVEACDGTASNKTSLRERIVFVERAPE